MNYHHAFRWTPQSQYPMSSGQHMVTPQPMYPGQQFGQFQYPIYQGQQFSQTPYPMKHGQQSGQSPYPMEHGHIAPQQGQQMQMKNMVLRTVHPIAEYGLNEASFTSTAHAMTEVAAIAYLMGRGYDFTVARQLVESWEVNEQFYPTLSPY
ncbi:hypothetical protein [Halalkalibacterium ligniniphilum]|uniref:hypothetical protein n=1 Tax=Halalkalibacterium ligniniphilum TaxID=1134413 RepID=UPI00037EC9F1|nr:hypothetical protein [Halalkalibacterium ligniniphilum]